MQKLDCVVSEPIFASFHLLASFSDGVSSSLDSRAPLQSCSVSLDTASDKWTDVLQPLMSHNRKSCNATVHLPGTQSSNAKENYNRAHRLNES